MAVALIVVGIVVAAASELLAGAVVWLVAMGATGSPLTTNESVGGAIVAVFAPIAVYAYGRATTR